MLDEVINRVLKQHDEFTYDEVKEICDEFYNEIPNKIKQETKIKRLNKFLDKEFELESNFETQIISNKKYKLENIPKYLFEGKTQISSSLVNISNLSKNIEQTHLFENANLKVNKTDKIALIGKNGCGKTTLLKMIISKEEITDGVIELAKDLKIGYLSQDLFWKNKKNTLREEMLSIFSEINEKIAKLNEIKNNPLTPYSEMSCNSSDKWEEIESLNKELVEVDLLILDEPTNHLDINGIIFLEKFCRNWKKAILSISHDIRFIDNTSNKIAEISEKQIHVYPGNYHEYLILKQEKYDKQLKDFNTQKREIEKQTDYINRFRANSAKAVSVQSRIKALDKLEKLEKPVDEKTVKSITINSDKRLPEVVMKLKNIEVGYDYPIVTLPEHIEVYKADKIGIIGANGAGKTTLLKTILGELESFSGISEINETILIGSYSQVLEDLNVDLSIIEELGKDYESEKEIRTILGGLLITGDKVDQKISTLSGGERAKVALTKMLLVKPHIIIMDEPTNHLDLHSKEVIKNMLEGFNGTTIIVSHDRDLLHSVSNKVWLIKDQILVTYDEPEIGFGEIF